MVETQWQTRIAQSCTLQGGHGRKWASSMQVGQPDLVLALPNTGCFLMEVKLFKDAPTTFNRKVDTTIKQKDELKKYCEAGALALVGVVVVVGTGPSSAKNTRLFALPWWVESLKHDDDYPVALWRGNKEGFDMIGLMNNFRRYTK